MNVAHRFALVGLVSLLALSAGAPAALAQQATHEFRILLLRGTPGDPHIPDLQPDAVAALRDLQGVLAFRHFELIDAGWVRTNEGARVHLGDAGSYEVGLYLREPEAGASLQQTAAAGASELHIRAFELDYSRVHRFDDGRAALGDARNLLATSFSVRVGETVVVGTSRAEGENEALIVLLQAVR